MSQPSNHPSSPVPEGTGDAQQPAAVPPPAPANPGGAQSPPTSSGGAQSPPANLSGGQPPPPGNQPGYGAPAGYGQQEYPGTGGASWYNQPQYPGAAGPAGYGPVPPPAPFGPLPGFGVPVQPPVKSNRGWIIGLSIAAVVLLLCCGCGGIGSYVVYRVIESERDQASSNTTEYLDALKAQRFNEAYGLMCDRNRSRQSKEQFIAEQQFKPRLISYDVEGVALVHKDGVEYQVKTRQKFDDGLQQIRRINVVSERDNLRPCP